MNTSAKIILALFAFAIGLAAADKLTRAPQAKQGQHAPIVWTAEELRALKQAYIDSTPAPELRCVHLVSEGGVGFTRCWQE